MRFPDRPIIGILDRQRYWSFFKAYVICYVSLVGLYIVIDAFSNLDEFSKRAEGAGEMFRIMIRYYLVHQSQFFDQLCGVIGMMAAIFTVTWMQRNNEQLAMLAAGVSTYRAVFPVLVSSVLVSLIAVFNQEVVIPALGEELARRHDDDGQQKINVTSRYDSRKIMIHGRQADRDTRTIFPFYATIGVQILGSIREIEGEQATYIPVDHPTAPLTGGWLVRDATIQPPLDDETLRGSTEILSRVVDLTGFPPPCALPDRNRRRGADSPSDATSPTTTPLTPHSEVAYIASLPPFPLTLSWETRKTHALLDRKLDFGRGAYFLKSSLTFQAMTRKPNWYQFAPTPELLESLADSSSREGSEALDVAIFIHSRLLRPVLGMALLLVSLPLVLGGYGRNTFINLGFALGTSALFYGTLIFTQYLAGFVMIPPPLSAWAPLILFGTIATVRWGQIRT